MNRIAISMTMLIPPLFLLSLALAQPVSAAPPDGAAAVALPWGPAAIPGSEVVSGECTGSACSASSAGGGPAHVPAPLRAAPLVVNVTPDPARANVAPGTLGVNVAPNALRVNVSSDGLRTSDGLPGKVALEPLQVNVVSDAPLVPVPADALRVDVAPDALRGGPVSKALRVDSAFDMGSADGGPTPISEDGGILIASDIARGDGTGSASSLPRIVGDLLSRLLDLVRRAPLLLPH
ncbi:hypothetical protein [Nocardia sp. NPDC052112]|uniref:hypothetical protein n=1 Tax=Nocardia sp. NPDC052112 TaxID=3155646 RepID=UPI00344AC0DE